MPREQQWVKQHFGSGTVIVTRMDPTLPHYYVCGFKDEEGRHDVAESLVRWLNNGGERPVWMQNAHRDSETRITHEDGFAITATGPYIDRDPGACDWVNDDSWEARAARARLIDILKGVESNA